MKYGRGKWLYGTFLLVARDAARRFAFGHGGGKGRRGSWHPLILRWRRRRARQKELSTARAATSGSISWFPKFHFHYATYLSNRTWRDRASGSVPATGVSETRIVLDRLWKYVRGAGLPRQPQRTSRPLGPSHAGQGSRPKFDARLPSSTGSSQPHVAHSTAPPAAGRPPGTPFGTLPHLFRACTKSEERSQPFQTQTRIREHWRQIFRARLPAHGDRLPRLAPEPRAVRVKIDATEELVWRRAKRQPAEVIDVEHQQAAFDSFDRPAVRSFQSHEVLNSSPSSERAALLPITKLDPSFVDQLTDDVIRRVEQRARIERQRRGL
jgi:hypothetical protein